MSIPCHVRSRAISTIIILFDMSRRPTVLVRVMPNYTRRQSYLYTIFDPPCTFYRVLWSELQRAWGFA